jgi:hypothetical protein
MTFDELTQEQRNVWYAWENDMRALSGELQRLCNKMAALNDRYVAQIQDLFALLDTDVLPPNTSSLTGSQALLSDAESLTLQSHQQTILNTFNTDGHKQLRAKAAGAANV